MCVTGGKATTCRLHSLRAVGPLLMMTPEGFVKERAAELHFEFGTIERPFAEGQRTAENTAGSDGLQRGIGSNKSLC